MSNPTQTTDSSGATSASASSGTGLSTRSGGAKLETEHGRTSIADSVVEKIAGMAARQVSGVHALGRGTSRAIGGLRDKLPIGSASPSQGVSVEVGERQAAVDLDMVVEYGVSIVDLSQAVRRSVIQQVEAMTGLEVTEVNIAIDDVYLGETSEDEPRVQ
jgi:uncharacterized alkaline shock family protein YloU